MESFEFLPLLLFVAAIVVVNLLRQRAARIGKERAERQRAAAEAWGTQQRAELPPELPAELPAKLPAKLPADVLQEVPRTPEGEAAQAPWGRSPTRAEQPERVERPWAPVARTEVPLQPEAAQLSSYERSLERLAERTAERAARAAAMENPMLARAPSAAAGGPLGKRLLRTPADLRQAIVAVTVLGPCRANAPYDAGDPGGGPR